MNSILAWILLFAKNVSDSDARGTCNQYKRVGKTLAVILSQYGVVENRAEAYGGYMLS